MLSSSFGSYASSNQALLGEFTIQGDFKMYSQLHGYDDSSGFDLSSEMGLAAISKRIFTVFLKPSWITLKHHPFNAHIPGELPKSIRGDAMTDYKKAESDREMLLRGLSIIPISRTYNNSDQNGFFGLWRLIEFSPFRRYFFAIFDDNVYRRTEKMDQSTDKVVNSA